MMRRAFLIAIPVLAVAGAAEAQLPDFSGTWRLDVEDSTIRTPYGLAGLRNQAPEMLYVQQSRDGTLILSSRLPGSSPRNYEIEGQSWVQALEGDPSEVLVRSQVRGLMLITTGSGRAAGDSITIQEVLRIGTDGETLTLQTSTTVADQTPQTNVLLYRRVGGGG